MFTSKTSGNTSYVEMLRSITAVDVLLKGSGAAAVSEESESAAESDVVANGFKWKAMEQVYGHRYKPQRTVCLSLNKSFL